MKEYIFLGSRFIFKNSILMLYKSETVGVVSYVLTRLPLSAVAVALCPNYCKRVGGACTTTHQPYISIVLAHLIKIEQDFASFAPPT